MTFRRISIATVLLLVLPSCIDTGFDPPHLIKDPRILAIVAQPPEVAFGEDVTFELLLVDGDADTLPGEPGVELVWTSCISVAEILDAAGLGAGSGLSDTCDEGGDDLVRLQTEGLPPNQARLPGSAFLELVAMFMGGDPMMMPGGGDLDPELVETLTTVVAEVGVPLTVEVEAFRDGELIAFGFKRFAITQREDPTTNPPPPRIKINQYWMNARTSGDPRVCAPEAGMTPVVEAESEVELDPDDAEEDWLETYPVFALGNEIQRNEESAFYSWFVTAGELDESVTQRPNHQAIWTAPEEPGLYPIWVVVRDGHLGMSYCRMDVEVR